MRIRIDREAEAVHVSLTGTAEARRVDVAEGVAVAWDAAGRIVGVELRGVDASALHEFAVELAGLADRPAAIATPAATAAPRPAPSPPPPKPHEGPLTWDPEAEAAMLQVPFFNRGKTRLAASALARRRGQDRVTVDIVNSLGR